MGFVEAVRRGFSLAFNWQGRASRPEYWWFVLFSALCIFAALFVSLALDAFALYGIVYLVLFFPSLGAFVRRLHDTDRSGWWYWLSLVPLIGAIVLLVWLCQRSDPDHNRFGPPPA